jgi:exopolysaccharide biosynthesis polyprenyl glycosylphosphotransferase
MGRLKAIVKVQVIDFVTLVRAIKNNANFEIERVIELKLNLTNRLLKRLLDIMFSILLLICSSPLLLLLFFIIPLTSKGPALYFQERLGEKEEPFKIIKFRTMVIDAENQTGPILAKKNDPRVTKVGKIIRALRVDELPQLFNVLIGHMSLVGPRPERAFFVKQFKDKLPEYEQRMNVKPGITGLAQVMGDYYTSPKDKLKYDLMYIKKYSIWFDMKILIKTFLVILPLRSKSG